MEKIENYRKKQYYNYKNLSEILPLDTPLSIMIDPSNLCNFKCIFCPTGNSKLLKQIRRPKGMMDFELYCKIIEDISKFENKLKYLQLYKDGESFLNKNLGRMISYAKNKDVTEVISIVSNGSLISKDRALEIIDSGLDEIKISIEHTSDEGYKKITKKNYNYSSIRENVRFLYMEKARRKANLKIYTKILDTGLSEEEKQTFYNDFEEISDTINIESLMGWSDSEKEDFTLGFNTNVGMDGHTKLKPRNVCPEPFKRMAINFDGTVSVCCVDWTHGMVVGDVTNENLVDIWNGEKLYDFRLLHLTNLKNEIEACRNCKYILGMSSASHIDNVANELRNKLEQIWLHKQE